MGVKGGLVVLWWCGGGRLVVVKVDDLDLVVGGGSCLM